MFVHAQAVSQGQGSSIARVPTSFLSLSSFPLSLPLRFLPLLFFTQHLSLSLFVFSTLLGSSGQGILGLLPLSPATDPTPHPTPSVDTQTKPASNGLQLCK